MPLSPDRPPNDGVCGKSDKAMREDSVSSPGRLNDRVGRDMSLALARWAVAVLLDRRKPGAHQ
jgi:hypothetical protein